MPTYEYACRSCGEHLEIVQSFRDQTLTECPSCGGSLRKVFGSVGIVFKGSGFYKTDNRHSGKSGQAAASVSSTSGESSAKSSDSTDTAKSNGKTESSAKPPTPAAATAAG